MALAEQEAETPPFVDEITRYMGANADTSPLKFDGMPGSRAQHARKLKHCQGRLASMLLDNPRQSRETPKAWIDRVRKNSPRYEEGVLLGMIGRLHAAIQRMDDEIELERRKAAEVESAKHASMIADLRRRATPDEAQVKQLVASIEDAVEQEELLASIYAAFTAYTKAQRARRQLTSIFEGAGNARNLLRAHGQQVTEKLPMRPAVCDAPEGAIEMATLLERVISLQRPRN